MRKNAQTAEENYWLTPAFSVIMYIYCLFYNIGIRATRESLQISYCLLILLARKDIKMVIHEVDFFEKLFGFFEDYVIHPISNISIVNILDIIILSWLIYVLYKFIRDRHAFKILLGFGALIGLYIVSDIIGMVAINSILQTFYAVGIIALCIIFYW